MNNQNSTATGGTPSMRSGSSRKLLARKAMAQPQAAHSNAVEDVFPANTGLAENEVAELNASAETAAEAANEAQSSANDVALHRPCETGSDAAQAEQHIVALKPTWSDEDERAFGVMAARRKAAGFQRRGKDVGGQLLRVGGIVPNPGTVVATIVGLVAERGTVARGDLLALIGTTTFGNSKSRPQDRGWCQGYVQGAVRDGFLADAAAGLTGEASPAGVGAPEVLL